VARIEDQRPIVNSGLPAIARDLQLPMVCTNEVHYLRNTDAQPARHPAVHRHRQGRFNDSKRLPLHAKEFFLKTADEMAEVFKDFPTRSANTVADRRALQRDDREGQNFLPDFDVPAGFTVDSYFEQGRARRFRRAAAAAAAAGAAGSLRHTIDEYERRPGVRARDDQADEVPGVLPDRLGLHPLRARAGHPGRPGPRLAAGSLVAYCMRITDVDPIDFDLIFERFLNPSACRCPTSTSTSASGARRGDRVRDAQVRPRERRADHHVRHDEGEGGRARRRPRARECRTPTSTRWRSRFRRRST
jgi:DNA polymerase-3 subunit alpha